MSRYRAKAPASFRDWPMAWLPHLVQANGFRTCRRRRLRRRGTQCRRLAPSQSSFKTMREVGSGLARDEAVPLSQLITWSRIGLASFLLYWPVTNPAFQYFHSSNRERANSAPPPSLPHSESRAPSA